MTDTTRHELSVPAQRKPTREVAIRELRNAGRVIDRLAEAGEIGSVTRDGHLIGWLVPVDPAQRRIDELVAQGKLSANPATAGALACRKPRERRPDLPPLSETLLQMREESN